MSDGNLKIVTNSSGYGVYTSTIGMSSGKWYAEAVATAMTYTHFGLIKSDVNYSSSTIVGNATDTAAYRSNDGVFRLGNSNKFTGATFAANDVIGLGFDADAGSCAVYKNGSLQGTATGFSSGTWFFAGSDNDGTTSATHVWNFGQRPFKYTNAGTNRPAATYLSLCTTNLADPTIADGSTAFDVALYTGNGSTQSITGLNHSPDFVWIKCRSAAKSHSWFDSVRGATKLLKSDVTQSESTQSGGVTSFDSNGFSMGSRGGNNENNATFVAWAWDAGTSTVTNTDGSITSNVRVNQSTGFSIATYTGNGTVNSTVGHGLNAAPSLVIIKNRSNAYGWAVLHTSAGTTGTTLDGSAEYYMLQLDSDAARNNFTNDNIWNPTNSTFKINGSGTANWVNANGDYYVAYSWAPVEGFSAFGSYEGNGSNDGPFVYTGFRPRWVIIKNVDNYGTGYDWFIFDTARDTFNVADNPLNANLNAAEADYD